MDEELISLWRSLKKNDVKYILVANCNLHLRTSIYLPITFQSPPSCIDIPSVPTTTPFAIKQSISFSSFTIV